LDGSEAGGGPREDLREGKNRERPFPERKKSLQKREVKKKNEEERTARTIL